MRGRGLWFLPILILKIQNGYESGQTIVGKAYFDLHYATNRLLVSMLESNNQLFY